MRGDVIVLLSYLEAVEIEQLAQRSCGYPIPGGAQGHVG